MNSQAQDRDMQNIQKVLGMLQLTEKNQKIAEQYMNISAPEDTTLLKEVEHQSFANFSRDIDYELYTFLQMYKSTKTELAGRFIRLTAEIGGETSSNFLVYCQIFQNINYLGKFLSPIQKAVIHANTIVSDSRNFSANFIEPLVRMGTKNPEVFSQMIELCYNEEKVNTKMFLAALYLHCVKPSEDAKGTLYIAMNEDDRTFGDPDCTKKMRTYLEHCLTVNIGKLMTKDSQLEKTNLELLQNFVQNATLNEPIPEDIRSILAGKCRNDYQMAFLPFLAFLAIEHSDQFVSVIRLADALDFMAVKNSPLDYCLVAGQDWFDRHIFALRNYLIIPDDMYLRWAVSKKQTKILEYIAKKAPETTCDVLMDLPVNEKGYLITYIKTGNPLFYEENKELFCDNYRKAAAKQAASIFNTSQNEAERYLLGEIQISDILFCVPSWRDANGRQWRTQCKDIYNYILCGELQVYKRALVLEFLSLNTNYISEFWIDLELNQTESALKYKEVDSRQTNSILKLMDEEKIPPQYQIEFLSTAYNKSYFAFYYRKNAYQECLEVIASYHDDWHNEWKSASQSHFMPSRILAIRVMELQWEEYKEELLACAKENSKEARELLQAIYVAHPDCEEQILTMLKSPRGPEREMAIEVLCCWGVEKYHNVLSVALENEKTKKIRTIIQNAIGVEICQNNTAESTLENLVHEILIGTWKRKLSWLSFESVPKVHKRDKEQATEEYLAAILISYNDMKTLGISKEAQRLAAELNPAELARYIKEIYHFWINEGAQAKRKWVLYAASIHGGETMVTELYAQLQDWAKEGRGAMAAEAVKALALNSSPTALVLVDQISRKFKNRQVKAAAVQALDYAAEQLGITREEMEDRIVPNLGFNTQMERIFDYGKRQFRVVLTPTLSLAVYDENGKQLKNLPAPGKTDETELAKAANDAWKQLKKQLKTVISAQKLRLEQALITGRQWESKNWKALFVENPVMHQFATGLLWGVYQNKGSDRILTKAFRYMEDGTFNTVEEDEYQLSEVANIGLVHPLELSEEELIAWKEQLSDYEIVQPIEQLERPIFRLTEQEKNALELTRFGGVVVNSRALFSKLQNMGWYKGYVGDGGSFDTYNRTDQDKVVELKFSGDDIVGLDIDVIVYGAYFSKIGESNQVVSCKLEEVDPRYFSEIILQLTKATASSTKRESYPDCKNQRWF